MPKLYPNAVGTSVFVLAALTWSNTCSEPLVAADDPHQFWRDINRVLSVQAGQLTQNYVERDIFRLTSDGILDAERGPISGIGFTARYLGRLISANSTADLYLQADYRNLRGRTSYRGYLISGNQLVPYATTTNNVETWFSARLGVAIAMPSRIVVIPFTEYGRRRWERGLTQYAEYYEHHTWAAGLLAQWCFIPDWILEGEFFSGRTRDVTVRAPALNLNASLGTKAVSGASASISHRVTEHWKVSVRWSEIAFGYGHSNLSAPIVEPDSTTRQRAVAFGIEYLY